MHKNNTENKFERIEQLLGKMEEHEEYNHKWRISVKIDCCVLLKALQTIHNKECGENNDADTTGN